MKESSINQSESFEEWLEKLNAKHKAFMENARKSINEMLEKYDSRPKIGADKETPSYRCSSYEDSCLEFGGKFNKTESTSNRMTVDPHPGQMAGNTFNKNNEEVLKSHKEPCKDWHIAHKLISEKSSAIDSNENVVLQLKNKEKPTSFNHPSCSESQFKFDSKYKKIQKSKENHAPQKSTIATKENNERKNPKKSIIKSIELKHELTIPNNGKENQRLAGLPDLTPEQENLVDTALKSTPADKVLIGKYKINIFKEDLETLSRDKWLNDKIINFYMNLIMQRSKERKDLPKLYATNTFFYHKLKCSGYNGVKSWTKEVDIFAYDVIVVPVYLGNHWCVSFINFRKRKIEYLDSRVQKNDSHTCLDALLQYLKNEHQDRKGVPFDDNGWETKVREDIPQQRNNYDCGIFMCTFVEFSSRNAAYTFTQAHMPYLRRKAALEIITGKLLL
ncbi:unnamed protein product [Spodoptera exigua]|nr:unnamed protein product [Spodoptera exigua]